MKYQVLFWITTISLFYSVNSLKKNDCDITTCNSSKPSSNEAICYKTSSLSLGEGKKYEFQKCNSGYNCEGALINVFTGDTSSVSCSKADTGGSDVKIEEEETNLYPGEECSKNSNCYSNDCNGGKCNGKTLGESCILFSECDVGLSCIDSQCSKQRTSGESCTTEFDCLNDLGCSSQKCVMYNSLENGAESSDGDVCKSGRIRLKDTIYICDSLTLKKSSCGEDQDTCIYSYAIDGSEITDECWCVEGSSSQERECLSDSSIEKIKYVTGVHTGLRHKIDIDLALSYVSKFDNCVGSTIFGEDTWNEFAKFIKSSYYYFNAFILLFYMALIL